MINQDVEKQSKLVMYLADVAVRNKLVVHTHQTESAGTITEGYKIDAVNAKVQKIYTKSIRKTEYYLEYCDYQFAISEDAWLHSSLKLDAMHLKTEEILLYRLDSLLDNIDIKTFWIVTIREENEFAKTIMYWTKLIDRHPAEYLSMLNNAFPDARRFSIVFATKEVDQQLYDKYKDELDQTSRI